MSWFKQGQKDQQQNKGAPSKFESPQARDKYLAGQHSQKKK